MKKIMSVMLGLSLIVGAAGMAFAQAPPKDEPKKEVKKGKAKKGKAPKDKDAKDKGKN